MEEEKSGKAGVAGETPVRARPLRRPRRPQMRISLTAILTLTFLALAFGYVVMAKTGQTLRLPVMAVAELESRLNRGLIDTTLPSGAAVSLGAVELAVDEGFVPRFRLQDIRLIDRSGRSLVALPEALVTLDPRALASGQVRATSVRLVGARLSVRRDVQGGLDLDLGMGSQAGGDPAQTPEQLLDSVVRLFDAPALTALRVVEAEALTLTLVDERAGRSWAVGDGRLAIENREGAVAAELSLSLLDGEVPAQAALTLVIDKANGAARMTAKVDRIAARDLAVLAPPLAWLAAVEAPISGALAAGITDKGRIDDLTGRLELAAGRIAPVDGARPIPFDRAGLTLRFDPQAARLTVDDLEVESASLRLRASGHGDLLTWDGQPMRPDGLPETLVAQIAFDEVVIDPEGLFEEAVRFTGGALDLRLRPDPFQLEIGQLVLVEGERRLQLSGTVLARPEGWEGGLDVGLNQVDAEELLKLWPVSAVPKTRGWFAANVGQAELTEVRAALRFDPIEAPRFSLSYDFAEAEVRMVRTLPRVREAQGHAMLDGSTYTVHLERGYLVPPEGGRIDADGSVFQVLDLAAKPAIARVDLVTSSSLLATLSLLDQEPFSFFSRAGLPVNLGEGRAELRTTLFLPLEQRIGVEDIDYVVTGQILDFRSPALVPGRVLSAPEVTVAVDTEGLTLSGKGMLNLMPVDLTYRQGFGPEQNGRARIDGTVTLSDAILRDLGIAFPAGMVTGEGEAAIDIALVRDLPAQLTLTSNLRGLGLRLDALGWSKPAGTRGDLDLVARLDRSPVVERLVLSAPGLSAEGRITTREGGGLDTARFSRVVAGNWLDAPVTLTGVAGNPVPEVAITGGRLDLRSMPGGGSGQGGGLIRLTLDRLVISSGIALTDFRATLRTRGGLSGEFTALVNGAGAISGAVAPARGGTAIRVTSDNAGAVMAAAGIFDKGRGGSLDMTLVPRGAAGQYDGSATFTRLRVQGAPALAELLSALSIVGLLEQMNGEGLAFNNGEVRFVLAPEAVEITQGSAVGASLGISFAGLYQNDSGRLDLQGVISPIYLVNGVGEIVSKRGEGLFGFNYRVTGTADDPRVSVNPLSVLTPGIFREIFRQAPPNLQDMEASGG